MEAVEEQWHNETNELAALVSRLQEENRRMTKEANSPRHESKSTKDNQMENPMNPSDFQLLQRLRAQLEKQRDELMCRDQEIQEKNNEIENVNSPFSFSIFGIERKINDLFCDLFLVDNSIGTIKNIVTRST